MIEITISCEEDELIVNSSRIKEAVRMFPEYYYDCKRKEIKEFYGMAMYYNEKGQPCPLVFEAKNFPDRQTEMNGFVDALIVRFGIERELKKKGFLECRAVIEPFELEDGTVDGVCIMLYAWSEKR